MTDCKHCGLQIYNSGSGYYLHEASKGSDLRYTMCVNALESRSLPVPAGIRLGHLSATPSDTPDAIYIELKPAVTWNFAPYRSNVTYTRTATFSANPGVEIVEDNE